MLKTALPAFQCKNSSELDTICGEILSFASPLKIFALYGEMGSGKTTMVQHFCNLLNVTDAVASPTFSIVNEYRTASGEAVYHFDFYRINSLTEVYDLGYENYFYSDNFIFIEWAEKILPLLTFPHIKIEITVNPPGDGHNQPGTRVISCSYEQKAR